MSGHAIRPALSARRARLWAVMALMLTAATARAQQACPSGFTVVDGTSGCYKVVHNPLTWEDALSNCAKYNSDLVPITSMQQDQALNSYLQAHHDQECYSATEADYTYAIGGQRSVPAPNTSACSTATKNFVWVSRDGTRVPFRYTQWGRGQPSCVNRTPENCVQLWTKTNEWNDYPCEYTLCSICYIQ